MGTDDAVVCQRHLSSSSSLRRFNFPEDDLASLHVYPGPRGFQYYLKFTVEGQLRLLSQGGHDHKAPKFSGSTGEEMPEL